LDKKSAREKKEKRRYLLLIIVYLRFEFLFDSLLRIMITHRYQFFVIDFLYCQAMASNSQSRTGSIMRV
jgi:hypothetical protein